MTGLGMVTMASAVQGWLIGKCNIIERLLLLASTVIFMFPAMISGFVLPHSQRWWGYLAAIALLGLVLVWQKLRYDPKKVSERSEEMMESEELAAS